MSTIPPIESTARTPRQQWMGTLAKAPAEQLEALWQGLGVKPEYRIIRTPETGLVMVRGRVGGNGNRFNLGEMTVSRCVVRLSSGETGFSYRAGRDRRAAEIAALADAMLQTEGWSEVIHARLITPLAGVQTAQREQTARRSAATRVDFFTMTRDRGAR